MAVCPQTFPLPSGFKSLTTSSRVKHWKVPFTESSPSVALGPAVFLLKVSRTINSPYRQRIGQKKVSATPPGIVDSHQNDQELLAKLLPVRHGERNECPKEPHAKCHKGDDEGRFVPQLGGIIQGLREEQSPR